MLFCNKLKNLYIRVWLVMVVGKNVLTPRREKKAFLAIEYFNVRKFIFKIFLFVSVCAAIFNDNLKVNQTQQFMQVLIFRVMYAFNIAIVESAS